MNVLENGIRIWSKGKLELTLGALEGELKQLKKLILDVVEDIKRTGKAILETPISIRLEKVYLQYADGGYVGFGGYRITINFADDVESTVGGGRKTEKVLGGGLEGGSGTALAQYGDDFGKMGTYVENPNIEVDWTQVTAHGADRLQQRGMTQEMVNSIVENGKVLSQNNGSKFAFITKEGVAIVSKEGNLITAWSSNDFDSNMLEIIKGLFGE